MNQPWPKLLETARWTPSPHNTQPWLLEPHDDRHATLWLDGRRALPDEDTTGCFVLCAMAMFVESLAITASHAGFTLAATFDDPDIRGLRTGRVRFAQLTLTDGAAPDTLTPQDIQQRRTSRLSTYPGEIDPAVWNDLVTQARSAGHTLTRTDDPALIAAIIDRTFTALSEDLNTPSYRREIAAWYRYGAAHARRTKDGLDNRAMGVPRHEFYMSANFPAFLKAPLLSAFARRLYLKRLGAFHHLAFLSGPFFSPAEARVAGRMFMRLWLTMHRAGLAIHPFGGLVTNADAHAWLTKATGTPDIWFVVRLGRTDPPLRSQRLDTERLLCTRP